MTKKTETTDIALGTNYFRQRYLYAFATQGEIVTHIRTQAHEADAVRMPEIFSSWQKLQKRVGALIQAETAAGIADRSILEELTGKAAATVAAMAETKLFKQTFSLLPTSFALVEIDSLVAAQKNVNLDYVEELQKHYKSKESIDELVAICVSLQREMPAIQHLEVGNNTHIFSSPNLDLRFLGSFLKKLTPDDMNYLVTGGLPVAAVISFVGYGGAPVNIYKVGNRLVLSNGFHRVFALRSLGIKKVPVVIQHVNNPQLEFPPVLAGIPREYILNTPRPVLMKDFFEKDFCITLKAKEKMKVVTVSAQINQLDVPS